MTGKIATAKSEAISAAAADATTKANQALADAKTYANQISSDLSSDYESKIKAIKDEIADGIHFIGHVTAINDENGTYTIGEATTKAKNGDLVILNSAEYIWSETARKWELFGDEGNFATKKYVDDAKAAAIASTRNAVYVETDLADDAIAAYKADVTKNTGDILINKVTIKDKDGNPGSGTDGKAKTQFTAYVWNGAAWAAMDGNYNAENTYLADDITITQAFGQYDIDSTSGRGTIPCKGWNMKELISKSFAKATSATKVNPTNSVSTPSSYSDNVEVGTWRSGANGNNALVFTYTADGKWSNYNAGKVAGNTVLKKDIMRALGVAELDNPVSIEFYCTSFEAKDKIVAFINDYNASAPDEDKIVYGDTLSTIMGFVNTMVNTITGVLVGFAAISLIVSTIMIAIIIYTSVLERRKEIGVLRSIGARKRDISRVFIAESAILGGYSGLIGIIISVALSFIGSAILKAVFKISGLMQVVWWQCLLMFAISILLSMFAGFIPSRIAAKKDPAIALRSE